MRQLLPIDRVIINRNDDPFMTANDLSANGGSDARPRYQAVTALCGRPVPSYADKNARSALLTRRSARPDRTRITQGIQPGTAIRHAIQHVLNEIHIAIPL